MFKTLLISMSTLLALASAPTMAHGDHESSAYGQPGNPGKASRTIDVTMRDTMRFDPSAIAVKRGETIRFAIHNGGALRHEFMLGTTAELNEHADMMRKMPGMSHQDPNAVTVEAGANAELVWKFDKAGTFDFACLIPGHFEAGMKGTITVR